MHPIDIYGKFGIFVLGKGIMRPFGTLLYSAPPHPSAAQGWCRQGEMSAQIPEGPVLGNRLLLLHCGPASRHIFKEHTYHRDPSGLFFLFFPNN